MHNSLVTPFRLGFNHKDIPLSYTYKLNGV